MNQIAEVFMQGKYSLGIFNDLSEAFDTVNNNILLENLKAFGIQSENLECFRTYLTNRKQSVSYNHFKTETKIAKCSFPHGSVLEPFFYFSYFCKRSQQLD